MTIDAGWAVVTGAGGGLGRALARALAVRGRSVAALGRDMAALRETAGEAYIHPVLCDLRDLAAIDAAFTALEAERPVTTLVNNAAVYPRRDILDETAESFMESVATNLGGTVGCTLAALRGMIDRGEGRILNVATFADVAPIPASAAYATSKGAARVFTRALVADLGDRFPGIVVGDWMPGMLATRMGVAEGLPPEVAAEWGAELALWHDPTLNGATFEMDTEIPPPRSLKRRLADRALFRRPVVRRLGTS